MPWLNAKGDSGSLDFLAPLVTAWAAAQRGDLDEALAGIDQIPANGLLAPLRAEERALILLKFRRTAEADPFAQRAVAAAGNRENRLRLAFADAYLAAGDQARALGDGRRDGDRGRSGAGADPRAQVERNRDRYARRGA